MLKPSERERIQDCMMLVQSAENTLEGISREIVPTVEEIRDCFESADKALRQALNA